MFCLLTIFSNPAGHWPLPRIFWLPGAPGGFSSARCWRSPASGWLKLAPTSSALSAPTFLSSATAWTSPIPIGNCRLSAVSSPRRTPARSKRQFRKPPRVFESRFQSFVALGDPSHGRARVSQLRAELAKQGLTGFIVPRADEHQNEYVPANAERLGVVRKDTAALFVDGRYTQQVKTEADASLFEFRRVPEDPPSEWIAGQLKPSDKLGYDPRLQTPEAVARYAAACEKAGASLVPVDSNPVDAIWPDRPPAPLGAITPHKLRFAGEGALKKIARVRQALGSSHGLLISDPHNLAWLFNVRGSDVSYTPLPIGWAYLPLEGRPVVFLDGRKLSPASRQSLSRQADVLEPDALLEFVEDLGRRGERVAFDVATVPAYLIQAIERAGGKADIGADPITLMKAKKNPAELAGSRAAHERDGAAMVNFLAWFAKEAPRGRLTEVDAVKALETFRRASPALKDLSFPTIAGAGPNSAIPHYRVSEESNRKIERGIFLIDSGAQYEDGTTDITRTVAVGRPSALMRDRFTRVLKGHIAVSRAVFPPGTNGAQIDALARAALWRAGLDFDHGTGHGIGSYLSVHEGPQRIAKTGTTALAPGMIISNEPGYYAAGAFGIRIENLLVVEARAIPGGERPMLGFETLTFAPIDLSLVEPKLMDAAEIAWLNDYHARVRRVLSPRVDSSTRRWLAKATQRLAPAKHPVSRSG